jgi:hypothetical protein
MGALGGGLTAPGDGPDVDAMQPSQHVPFGGKVLKSLAPANAEPAAGQEAGDTHRMLR